MSHFVRSGSLLAVCLLAFSPSLLADRVHRFTDRVGSDFDNPIVFTHADSASVDGDSAFLKPKTIGANEDHVNWLGDFDDDRGKAWGWRKHLHHHYYGDTGENFEDQDNDNGDVDGNTGNSGNVGTGGTSTVGIPEPSVLVLLSTALAAFLLKPLRKATV
jgi:hypothetical protein